MQTPPSRGHTGSPMTQTSHLTAHARWREPPYSGRPSPRLHSSSADPSLPPLTVRSPRAGGDHSARNSPDAGPPGKRLAWLTADVEFAATRSAACPSPPRPCGVPMDQSPDQLRPRGRKPARTAHPVRSEARPGSGRWLVCGHRPPSRAGAVVVERAQRARLSEGERAVIEGTEAGVLLQRPSRSGPERMPDQDQVVARRPDHGLNGGRIVQQARSRVVTRKSGVTTA
jgi:hypothetical protein